MLITHIHTYEQTAEADLYYKLTNEPIGSVELKVACLPREDSDQPVHPRTCPRMPRLI